jgi:hypothetical protein
MNEVALLIYNTVAYSEKNIDNCTQVLHLEIIFVEVQQKLNFLGEIVSLVGRNIDDYIKE